MTGSDEHNDAGKPDSNPSTPDFEPRLSGAEQLAKLWGLPMELYRGPRARSPGSEDQGITFIRGIHPGSAPRSKPDNAEGEA